MQVSDQTKSELKGKHELHTHSYRQETGERGAALAEREIGLESDSAGTKQGQQRAVWSAQQGALGVAPVARRDAAARVTSTSRTWLLVYEQEAWERSALEQTGCQSSRASAAWLPWESKRESTGPAI